MQKDEESMDFEERVAVAVERLAKVEGIGEVYADKLVFPFLTLEGYWRQNSQVESKDLG